MFIQDKIPALGLFPLLGVLFILSGCMNGRMTTGYSSEQSFQYPETKELVNLVNDASEQVRIKGESSFTEFRVPGSRWRHGEDYIFVLNPEGKMLVHPDPEMEGRNVINLKDVNGKPIIKGLISAARTSPDEPGGWYHYEWPVPGGLIPRWKSTYVELVRAPSGKSYIVGSGVYNDRMEPVFVVDMVENAVARIEKNGKAAFPLFYDQKGPFIAKDAYIFVFDEKGNDLVNPAFPNLEGRNLMDMKDTRGKKVIRDMLKVVKKRDSGWVNYMWPKPGDSVSTQKSAYVSKAKMGDQWVLVGSGVYLADAPREKPTAKKMTAPQLMKLVRNAAEEFEKKGEKAYPEFRKKGSKWFHDDTYFFVWDMNGTRVFHAANPAGEGKNMTDLEDIKGRPIGQMILNTGESRTGEGWIHYMYPEPGGMFPEWKSTFVKKVTFPDGKKYIIGCGIYNMQMDRVFVEDEVNRAAELISEKGKKAFNRLRDKTGPFVFMDAYVFVMTKDGTQLVNPAQPSLEGKHLMNIKDLKGKAFVREYTAAALKNGSAWVEYYWYKPGENTPALKETYVKKVKSGKNTYIVGSGFYPEQ